MKKFQFEGKGNVSGDRIRELRLPDDENDSDLFRCQSGCKPEQKQREQPEDFPIFEESICCAVPALEYIVNTLEK